MPRFVHIDHSLCRVGGHEFDYALNVLRAAEARGYDVSLATNRRFRDRTGLPGHWPVYATFPCAVQTTYSVRYRNPDHQPMDLDGRPLTLAETPHGSPPLTADFVGRFRRAYRLVRCRRELRAFARFCRSVFDGSRLTESDHVFFATMTDFELLGLARYLVDEPRSQGANWHLQFHYDLFACRGEKGPSWRRRKAILQRQFRYALDRLPHHRLFLYTTTEGLAHQYNSLGVATFRCLPYPVNPGMRPDEAQADTRPPVEPLAEKHAPAGRDAVPVVRPRKTEALAERTGGPLQITCAGGMRREKGIHDLRTILQRVRCDPLFEGTIQIAAQLTPGKLRQYGIVDPQAQGQPARVPVRSVPYPLATDLYHRLIRHTDIGLFLYDNRQYHLRCSGILQEMLASGKPVIVPGGCWLADQIAEPIFRHVEHLRRTLPVAGRLRPQDLRWTTSGSGGPAAASTAPGVPRGRTQEMTAELTVPMPATEIVVAFRLAPAAPQGEYVRVQIRQYDAAGHAVDRFESIVGTRRDGQPALSLTHLVPQAVRLAVVLRQVDHQDLPPLSDVEVDFLDARDMGACPAGSVGLIASGPACVPALLREMIRHFGHYRQTAEDFCRGYLHAHHPARTIEILTAEDGRAQPGPGPLGEGRMTEPGDTYGDRAITPVQTFAAGEESGRVSPAESHLLGKAA